MNRAEWISVIAIIISTITAFAAPLVQVLFQHRLNKPKATPIEKPIDAKKTRLSKILRHPLFANSFSLFSIINSLIVLINIYRLPASPITKEQIFKICFHFSIIVFQIGLIFLDLWAHLHSEIIQDLIDLSKSHLTITQKHIELLSLENHKEVKSATKEHT